MPSPPILPRNRKCGTLPRETVPDHGEERGSSGHRDYDYLEWIARLTSHIPDRGTQFVHYNGACSNTHRGIARQPVPGLRTAVRRPGERSSPIHPIPLDALCVRGFRVDSHPMVGILTAKGCRKRRCAKSRGR